MAAILRRLSSRRFPSIIRNARASSSESKEFDPKDPKHYQQQSVRVAVIGADTLTGTAVSFLLKQNPLVTGVFLQGCNRVVQIADDLNVFDTRSRAEAFVDRAGYKDAVRGADIVLMMSHTDAQTPLPSLDKFEREAPRVVEIAEACARQNPRSVIIVNVSPISYTVPLVREVFLRTPWYHPGKIFGASGVYQSKLNTMVARHQGLDPLSVFVPLVGGPDIDCLVPLFSRATPASLSTYEAKMILRKFRNLPDDVNLIKTPVKFTAELAPWSEAHALSRLVSAVGRGLCGDIEALACAFVRTNLIPSVKHMMCTVRFGSTGLAHNFGIPRLTSFEINLLEKALILLGERENEVKSWMDEFIKKRDAREKEALKYKEEMERRKMMREKFGKAPEVPKPPPDPNELDCKVE